MFERTVFGGKLLKFPKFLLRFKTRIFSIMNLLIFLFVFETKSHLQPWLAWKSLMETRLTSNLLRATCLCLLSPRIKGLCYHAKHCF